MGSPALVKMQSIAVKWIPWRSVGGRIAFDVCMYVCMYVLHFLESIAVVSFFFCICVLVCLLSLIDVCSYFHYNLCGPL